MVFVYVLKPRAADERFSQRRKGPASVHRYLEQSDLQHWPDVGFSRKP